MFKPGQSGNPSGRPKGHMKALNDALKKVAETKAGEDGKPKAFLEHLVERAYENDTVLVAVARKLLPDLKHIEADIGVSRYEDLTDEQLNAQISKAARDLGEGAEAIIGLILKSNIPQSRGKGKAAGSSGRKNKKKKAE